MHLASKATRAEAIAAANGKPIRYHYEPQVSAQQQLRRRLAEHYHDRRHPGPVPGNLYPKLSDIVGICPPEDVGGFPGYDAFLEAIANPKHHERQTMLTWRGRHSIPRAPEADELRLEVLKLAKKVEAAARIGGGVGRLLLTSRRTG